MSRAAKIQEAKSYLKSQGYYTDKIWCTEDVKSRFNCNEDEAQEVLDGALNNEATMEQIWFAINYHGEEEGLEKVQTK
tara:strand:+ start:924 stop:1157 length:234 start_codon:yes stop_codon:yes gene_type:complete